MAYLGIDPGASGGIARILRGEEGQPVNISSWPMPATDRDILDLLLDQSPAVAILEKVHSMPGQGVASSFKFGRGFGALMMALTAAQVPYTLATPQKWQRGVGVPKRGRTESKTQFKNRLKAEAQRRYPSQRVTLKTADALLIATYCFEQAGS